MARERDRPPAAGYVPEDAASPGRAAAGHVLAELRAARRRQRLHDFDVVEAIYRAYLTVVLGSVAVWLLSGVVGDTHLRGARLHHVVERGPAVAGVAFALALAIGLRSGGRGGPLAIEAADVSHVLMAPVDRELALRGPAWRQLRFGVVAGIGTGAVAGLLAFRRLAGPAPTWVACGALVGAVTVAGGLGAAMVVSGRRLPRWVATGLGAAILAWSALDVGADIRTSPATLVGEVALWPLQFRPLGLVGVAVAGLLAVAGLACVGGTSIEAAERRATLVGQLRFAATLRDLRTVMVLRRQLAQELPRSRPWLRLSPALLLAGSGLADGSVRVEPVPGSVPVEPLPASVPVEPVPGSAPSEPRRQKRWPVWRRGWHGLLRFPATRLLRMAALGAAAGAATLGAERGTTPLFALGGVALYAAALDAAEPLSQDLDHPDRLAGLPVVAGNHCLRQLAASLVAMVAVAAVGLAAAAAISLGDPQTVAVGAIMVVPAAAAALAGATVSVIQGAPNLVASYTFALPPEAVGFVAAVRVGLPPILAIVGVLPALAARHPGPKGALPGVEGGVIGVLALCGVVAAWVRWRDPIHAYIKEAMEELRGGTRVASAGDGPSTSPGPRR